MRSTEIDKHWRQRPFIPFRLWMTDGALFDVRHPEMIMVTRRVLVLATYKPGARMAEDTIYCDPVHIIRVETLDNGDSGPERPAKR